MVNYLGKAAWANNRWTVDETTDSLSLYQNPCISRMFVL